MAKSESMAVKVVRRCRGPEGVLLAGREYDLPKSVALDLLRSRAAVDPSGKIVVKAPADSMRGKDVSSEQPGGRGDADKPKKKTTLSTESGAGLVGGGKK